MFDTAAYLVELRSNREQAVALIGTNSLIANYRDAARILIDADDFRTNEAADHIFTADDLLNELVVAAGRANQAGMGASRAQIEFIVSLAIQNNDVRPMGYAMLTKRAASNLIDDLRAGR